MTLNPQQRIDDNLDTMLPSGRTVREACNTANWASVPRVRPARSWTLLVILFGRRPQR